MVCLQVLIICSLTGWFVENNSSTVGETDTTLHLGYVSLGAGWMVWIDGSTFVTLQCHSSWVGETMWMLFSVFVKNIISFCSIKSSWARFSKSLSLRKCIFKERTTQVIKRDIVKRWDICVSGNPELNCFVWYCQHGRNRNNSLTKVISC